MLMRADVLDTIKNLTKTDTKNLSAKSLKLMEECGELAKTVLPYENSAGTLHRVSHSGMIVEEVADVLLVALSIAYSLGYDDDTIASIMQDKAMYWARLQANESKVDPNNIPHELHLTVSDVKDLEKFKSDCASIGVKAIVLALHVNSGDDIKDIMTSQVVMGSTTQAFTAMTLTKARLIKMGYNVVRCKIESSPWHPSVPTASNNLPHVQHGYFEAHLEVTVYDDDSVRNLQMLKDIVGGTAHISSNAFKVCDGYSTVMVTIRRNSGTLERFELELSMLLESLSCFDVRDKVITEYALYDTNVNHDAEWLSNG